MIAPELVDEVRRLLAEGIYGYREIAQRTGVSRGSVGAIATGKRREHVVVARQLEEPAGPPRRCPGCGGMVLMPCLLCRVRDEAGDRRRAFPNVRHDDVRVGLDLRPDHFQRYLQVRRWRHENQGRPAMGDD